MGHTLDNKVCLDFLGELLDCEQIEQGKKLVIRLQKREKNSLRFSDNFFLVNFWIESGPIN
jgi:hypothetical protein